MPCMSLSSWSRGFSSFKFLLRVFLTASQRPLCVLFFWSALRRSHRNPNSRALGRSFWTAPASHHWNRGNEFIVSTDLDADYSLIWSSAGRSGPHFPWQSGLKLLGGKKELRGEMNEWRQVALWEACLPWTEARVRCGSFLWSWSGAMTGSSSELMCVRRTERTQAHIWRLSAGSGPWENNNQTILWPESLCVTYILIEIKLWFDTIYTIFGHTCTNVMHIVCILHLFNWNFKI